VAQVRIPPGPAERYDTAQDLLGWLDEHVRRYGDLYKASVYGGNVYVASAPAYAEHVLLDNWQNYIRKGQAVKRIALSLGNGIISSNGALWVKQRRMIQPAFSRNLICDMAPIIAKPNAALLGRWRKAAERGTRLNVTRDVSLLVLEITLTAIFGIDYDEVAPHFAIVAEESRNLGFAQTITSLGKLVVEIAERRRKTDTAGSDILGALMKSRDREGGQPMPDVQLAREVLTLIVAGHETTASVLNWTWYLLAMYPAVEAKLSAELDALMERSFPAVAEFPKFTYTRQVIEEALRLYPPLWLMTRKTVHDDRLGDYFVPAGTEIYISPYLLQHHPALWEAPERFEPDRFLPEVSDERQRLAMCPFGAGPRNCIGEFMARIEMQTHLMMIARDLRLRRAEQRPARMVAGTNLLSHHDFMMIPELKAPATA
jgi:enediyne biosynthesis protein E7